MTPVSDHRARSEDHPRSLLRVLAAGAEPDASVATRAVRACLDVDVKIG